VAETRYGGEVRLPPPELDNYKLSPAVLPTKEELGTEATRQGLAGV